MYLVVMVESQVGAGGTLPGVGQVLVDLSPGWNTRGVRDAVAYGAFAES